MVIKVNLVSETVIGFKANGVTTFFEEMRGLLKNSSEIELSINASGNSDTDIIHSHTIGPFSLIKSKCRPVSIITAHIIPESVQGSLAFDKAFHRQIVWYLRNLYNSYDYVVAISEYIKSRLVDIGVEEKKIVVIPNFVNRERYRPDERLAEEFRAKYSIGKEDFVILGVGQIQSRKGIEDFIEIGRMVPDAKFFWVGTRPFGALTSGYSRLNKSIESAPENVVFTGFVDSVIGAYSAAHAFLLPSYQDNFPLAVLEAASCGKAIVLRDNIEYQGIFKGLVLMQNDSREAIIRLKDDAEMLRKYSGLALELAERYDSKRILPRYIEFYKSVAGKKG